MSWVKPETYKDRLISLIAVCGELPADQLSRLPGGNEYKLNIIKQLKKKQMIKTFYKDGLRGYRLLLPAKDELLKQNDERFSFFLTGACETNHIRSEVPRRLRLHRMAETLITMQNGKVEIYRDNKPCIFAPERIGTLISFPAFYASREIKEMGIDTVKIKGARSMGVLMTESRIFAVYNIGDSLVEWDYKAETRYKALLKTVVCQDRMKHQYSVDSIEGMLFGNSMELAAEILSQPQNDSYFLLDGGYEHFYYLTNDSKGERILQMMCSTEKSELMLDLLGASCYDQDTTYGSRTGGNSGLRKKRTCVENTESGKSKNYRNGYSKKTVKTQMVEVDVKIPRDRNGEYEPKIIAKYSRNADGMEEKILALYVCGMSQRDISEQIKNLYDVEISDGLVSKIVEKVTPEVNAWQNRPLESVYPFIFMDAIHYKVKLIHSIIWCQV